MVSTLMSNFSRVASVALQVQNDLYITTIRGRAGEGGLLTSMGDQWAI